MLIQAFAKSSASRLSSASGSACGPASASRQMTAALSWWPQIPSTRAASSAAVAWSGAVTASPTASRSAAGGGRAALPGQRQAQFEQDRRPGCRLGGLVQRAAQVVRGRAGGAAAAGRLGGRAQQGHHAGTADRLAAQQVQREAFGVGPVAFQHPGGFGVGQGPLARRYRFIDRRAHDGMGELQHRPGREHVGRAQPVGQPAAAGGILARERGGVAQRRRAAEDRQRPGQLVGAFAELADPPQHRPGDRLRAEAVHPVPAGHRHPALAARWPALRAGTGSRRCWRDTPGTAPVIGLLAQPLPHQCRGGLRRQRP